jgi:hypothetical protein
MKTILSLSFLFFQIFAFSQKIDLTSDNAIREYLNEKVFKVGGYGSVQFFYDKYNRDYGTIDFKVFYQFSDKSIPLKASIYLKSDDFYIPNYFKSITITDVNPYNALNLGAPTLFQLFENGDLYYQEKTTISMEEWIAAISSGKTNVNIPLYKKCE